MKLRALIMLALAALLGLAAVYLARDWLESQTRQVAVPQNQLDLTTVVIARRPLSLGDQITREHVQEVSWPVNAVPLGSFRKIDELVKSDSEARVALRSIQVNEPILKDKISGFGGRATLSTLIEKDMRGVTIRVNDVLGVGGFVLPGDHVDVLLTRKKGKDEHITNILIQNVKVLGIDQEASDDKDKPKVVRAVTLQVEPDQGQKLALASLVGTLSLSLRHSLNTGAIVHRTIRERDLVDENVARQPEPVKPAAPAKVVRKKYNPYTSVKVVRGVKATTEQVVIEKPSTTRPATAAPRSLTPKKKSEPAPKATVTGPKAAPAPSEPAETSEKAAPKGPAERPDGKPIQLWRDDDGKTVQGTGRSADTISALPAAREG